MQEWGEREIDGRVSQWIRQSATSGCPERTAQSRSAWYLEFKIVYKKKKIKLTTLFMHKKTKFNQFYKYNDIMIYSKLLVRSFNHQNRFNLEIRYEDYRLKKGGVS